MNAKIIVAVVTCLGAAVGAFYFAQAQDPNIKAIQDRVDNTVRERGVVEPGDAAAIRSPVTGTVIFLAEEGQAVRTGDVVLRLDATAMEESVADQKINVESARAHLTQAEAAVESAKASLESEVTSAAGRLKLLQLKREAVVAEGGELDVETQSLQNEIEAATTKLQHAESSLKRYELLREKAVVSESDMAQVQLQVAQFRGELKTHHSKLNYLTKYAKPVRLAEVELAVQQAELQLTATRRSYEAMVSGEKANLAAQAQAHQVESERLEAAQRALAQCVVKAPRAGTIVYAVNRAARAGNIHPQVGAEVRERQPILQIADMSKLQIRVSVNETKLAKVRPGQSVLVRVDALRDAPVRGVVASVSNTPEPTNWMRSDVKEYAAVITLDVTPRGLRPGMTAEAEIDATK